MRSDKTKTVPYRRKKSGKTDYKKRLTLLKSKTVRAVVRKSTKSIYVQFVKFNPIGDKIIVSASSKDVEKMGWKLSKTSVPCAYLVGMAAGKKAQEKGVKQAILDIGFNTPTKGARVFAALKGIADSGLKIPFDKKVVPGEDRLNGKHLSNEKNDEKSIHEMITAVKSKIGA